jgi:branched-chain amino acid transport system permease protein
MLENLVASGIVMGAFYALLALGIVIVHKATNVVNFAHGEMLMIAAFATYALHTQLGLNYGSALVIAIVAAGILGAVTFELSYRPLMKDGLVSILLAMVGLAFVLRGAARTLWGGKGDYLTLDPVLPSNPIFLGTIALVPQQLLALAGAGVAFAGLGILFMKTQLGKSMRATADNPKAALLLGVRVDRVRLYAFMMSAAIAGLTAVLMAPLTLIYPDMGFALFVKAFAAAALGGLNSPVGAVVGGLILGVVEQLGAGYIDSSLQQISGFLVIMFTLIFLPTGLFGATATRRA